jgi:hypothetical protein
MKAPRPPLQLSPKARDLWRALNAESEFESDALATLTIALEHYDLGNRARELLRAPMAFCSTAASTLRWTPSRCTTYCFCDPCAHWVWTSRQPIR